MCWSRGAVDAGGLTGQDEECCRQVCGGIDKRTDMAAVWYREQLIEALCPRRECPWAIKELPALKKIDVALRDMRCIIVPESLPHLTHGP